MQGESGWARPEVRSKGALCGGGRGDCADDPRLPTLTGGIAGAGVLCGRASHFLTSDPRSLPPQADGQMLGILI